MTNRQRQHLLAYLGYYVMDITDKWTEECRVACRAFQEDFQGIQVDGLGGPETDKALRHAVAYDLFQVANAVDVGKAKDDPSKTGTFWDEIEFFTREEFRCQCGGKHCNGFPVEPEEALVRNVDEIRRRLGVPVQIVDAGGSGVRCPQHMLPWVVWPTVITCMAKPQICILPNLRRRWREWLKRCWVIPVRSVFTVGVSMWV